ncbi:hypothetical protein [Hymenobacter sp. YC55]|uniref:hypothetical protein n=1 Tax=Hymenobacter sp. YC55 TaxID=3034019 RepID=UPI0023F863CC|nr:hypothetical protein [Hymenobacter sp. YC55]MDF7815094.1 hypothetical protein [Hymenobacter sp. YC55]
MNDITLVSEAYGAVYLAPEVPCIIIQWTGYANSEQFRYLMKQAQAFYIAETPRHPAALGWIADSRGLGAVRPGDQQWLHTDWNPQTYQAGVRYIAIVEAESIFGKIAAQQYVTNVMQSEQYSFHTRTLPTLEAAKQWLQQVLPLAPEQ